MKKLLLLIISLVIVSGCSNSGLNNLESNITTLANTYYKLEAVNHKKYYTYYLEPSGKSIESTKTSSLIQFDDVQVVLNINVDDIINDKYYKNLQLTTNVSNKDILVDSFSGTYIDKLNIERNYSLKLYQLNKQYLVILQTPLAELYSIVYQGDIIETARNMMVIAKGLNVDTQAIIKDYSNVSQIDFVKEQIQLFEVIIPENGRIEEILLESLDHDQIIDDNNEFGTDGSLDEAPNDMVIEDQETD